MTGRTPFTHEGIAFGCDYNPSSGRPRCGTRTSA